MARASSPLDPLPEETSSDISLPEETTPDNSPTMPTFNRHAHGRTPSMSAPTTPSSTFGRVRFMNLTNESVPNFSITGFAPKLPIFQSTHSGAGRSGNWSCCQCKETNTVYLRPGKHPLGSLSCQCPHKPCEKCIFAGSLRHFVPIAEPLRVEVTTSGPGRLDSGHGKENVKEIPYGFICGGCGLSWRAQELQKMGLKKGKSMIKDAHENSMNKNKLLPTKQSRLMKSQSLMNLSFGAHRRTLSVAPIAGQGPSKVTDADADGALVKFSGIQCTCGCVSELDTCVCFKVVTELVIGPRPTTQGSDVTEAAKKETKTEEVKQVKKERGSEYKRYTNDKLLAKGHDSPEITLPGPGPKGERMHPNPLRSAPVED